MIRPHPSQTPPCRFPAAGSSSRTHCASPGVSDTRAQQRKALQKKLIALPREGFAARAPVKPLVPQTPDTHIELPQTAVVRRAAVVLVVAPKLRVEHVLLCAHGLVPMRAAPYGNGLGGPLQALLHRLHVHREFASAAARALMRKSEKVESVRFAARPFRLREGMAPEFHEAGLLRMQRQPELREPLR